MFRRTVLLVTIGVLGVAACQPAKPAPPPPPPPGALLAGYWLDENGGDRLLSPVPGTFSGQEVTVSQALLPDGSVVLQTTPTENQLGFIDNGFHTVAVPLGAIETVSMTGASTLEDVDPFPLGGVVVKLWLDTSGDGNFFDFAGGGSHEAVPFSSGGGIIQAIDGSTTVRVRPHTCCETSEDLTFAELKAGAYPGVGPSTPAVVVVWQASDAHEGITGTAVVTALHVNGIDWLVP